MNMTRPNHGYAYAVSLASELTPITKTFTTQIQILSRQVCGETLFLLMAAPLHLLGEEFAEMQNYSLIINTEENS